MQKQKNYSPSVFQEDILDENPFVQLHEIKEGDVFYECERGLNVEMKALGDARRTRNGWFCKVKTTQGIMNIYSSATQTMYGPNLYRTPYYITTNEKNESVFLIE